MADRDAAWAGGITVAIPRHENFRQRDRFFPKRLYKLRARVEQSIAKLKRFKRVAMRCEKTAASYSTVVSFARSAILIKFVHTVRGGDPMFGWLRRLALGSAPNRTSLAPQPKEAAPAGPSPSLPAPSEPPRPIPVPEASVLTTAPATSVAPAPRPEPRFRLPDPPAPPRPLDRQGSITPSGPPGRPPLQIVITLGQGQHAGGHASPKPRRAEDARWVPPGRSVTVQGYEIPDGMVYVGAFMTAAPGGGWAADTPAPCLLNPSLKVASRPVRSVSDMGYWRSYTDISPAQRQACLTWLSTGKRDASFPVGYAFLYFCGLERRLLADHPGPDEEARLVAEIRRLQGIYPENRSFMGYSQRLL